MIKLALPVVLILLNPCKGAPLTREASPQIFVAVSSLAGVEDGTIIERQLEVTWSGVTVSPSDQVRIYSLGDAPYCSAGSIWLEEAQLVDFVDEGFIRFNILFPHLTSAEVGYQSQCLVYWAALIRDGQIAACNCLRSYPSWMWERRQQLGNFKLREIFLPGTHDAAAYERYRGLISNNPATKYAITQDENLGLQLQYGVRYLDMRIIFRPNTEERFWTHHGTYILRPLLNDTALIREFLSNSQDIIIFDIHGVDGDFGADPNAHYELQDLLVEEFSQWIAPASLTWEVTLNQLWDSGNQIIVTYNDGHYQGSPFMWTAVAHQWGNVQDVSDLQDYLQGVIDSASQGFLPFPWSAMAELTPTNGDVVLDRFNGLRGAADDVNRNVTSWFRDEWAQHATIVACDFFLGTNIVELAISENERRATSVIRFG